MINSIRFEVQKSSTKSKVRRSGRLTVAVIVFIVVFAIQGTSALKCWRCTSDGKEFCGDTFDESQISDEQKRWYLVDCETSLDPVQHYGYPHEQKIVCKKMRELVFDRYVTRRSCYWENLNRPKDECLHNNTDPYIKMEFCETCETDGCNGSTQYGPITLLIAISAAFAKLFLL